MLALIWPLGRPTQSLISPERKAAWIFWREFSPSLELNGLFRWRSMRREMMVDRRLTFSASEDMGVSGSDASANASSIKRFAGTADVPPRKYANARGLLEAPPNSFHAP